MAGPLQCSTKTQEDYGIADTMKSSFILSSRCGLLVGGLLVCAGHLPAMASPTAAISLAGQWRFALDRSNAGLNQKWFERDLTGKVRLPGTLPAQGIGDAVSLDTKWMGEIQDPQWFNNPIYSPYTLPGSFKFPFWLQPEKYYAGAAWYQREIEIPLGWQDRRVVLTLERPHWETRVWLDSKELGSNNSLSTAHEYELGNQLAPGKHRLTVRVDNSLIVDVGVNSHCISDHTQGNWNGIVGDVSLRATPLVWVEELQVYPHIAARSVTVKGRIGNATGKSGQGLINLSAGRLDDAREKMPAKELEVGWDEKGGAFEAEFPLGNQSELWDEFNPSLYCLTAALAGAGDSCSATFGLREISTQGNQLLLNGHKLFIRGTLECCIFPLTGHPPTDVDSWKRVIRVAKAHGLNLIRFHSYCPPQAAFIAADQLGFYYQVETCWANQSTTLGDGKPVDQWVYDETARILRAYGNHPSFLLMPYGNEPGGSKANAYLARYVEHFKALDPRRLWTSGAGWPQLPENQFHLTPSPRIQSWGGGLKSRINARPPETRTDYRQYIGQCAVPVISHEIGEWCVYPNFGEIPKYKGYLKPRNFEVFRDTLRAHGMAGQARDFLYASGKLQTLCYKEDIESALRTPGMGGFELLDLHDFPGQGTALVGVLDPFWDGKGYVTAAQFSRFCNCTVPLARLSQRVFTSDQTLRADIEVAHFGPAPLKQAVVVWKLAACNGKAVASGQLPACDIPLGNGIALGALSVDLKDIPAPAAYKLLVGLDRTPFENDWDLWVYPPKVETVAPKDVAVVESLDDQTVAALEQGGKVLLFISPDRVRGDKLGKVALGFSSIFWNTAWTHRQPPHTLGILCNPKHPAFAHFPTDSYSNWQWWYLVSRAGAMILDDLPKDLRPTVQVIDDWVTNRRLGLVFEGRLGRGKLLVCSIDLSKDLRDNPVARQMLRSLLDYMAGPKFQPAIALTPEQVRSVMSPP